jgi:regulator of protease activity HflC (stomatin/prohibitin superfamily)
MSELFQWIANLLKQFRIFMTVLPWELAVRTRLGNRVKVWDPGWHLKLPFVDVVNVINTRMRVVRSPTQTITTKDGKTVSVSFTIGFSIHKPKDALPAISRISTSVGSWSSRRFGPIESFKSSGIRRRRQRRGWCRCPTEPRRNECWNT